MAHHGSNCCLMPEDLAILKRVLDTTTPAGASDIERTAHAETLLHLFSNGISDEADLKREILGLRKKGTSAMSG